MRKDILWEPYFTLAFHLKVSYEDFYKMPVRMRNWLLTRTAEEYKKQNEHQENSENDKNMVDLTQENNNGNFKLFK